MKTQFLAVGALLTSLALALSHGCAGPPASQSAVGIETAAGNGETVRIGSIDWYVNYDEALAEAKRTQRPVWLHFGENPG